MRITLLPVLLLLGSCSFFGAGEEETVKPESKSRLVGRIALVPPRENFVLVESYGPWQVPEGGLLSGIGTEGRTSNLVVTGEKLGQHVAADIRLGVAKVGDAVYYRSLEGEIEDEDSVDPPVPAPNTPELEAQKTGPESPAKP
jgi:hypothetical protein